MCCVDSWSLGRGEAWRRSILGSIVGRSFFKLLNYNKRSWLFFLLIHSFHLLNWLLLRFLILLLLCSPLKLLLQPLFFLFLLPLNEILIDSISQFVFLFLFGLLFFFLSQQLQSISFQLLIELLLFLKSFPLVLFFSFFLFFYLLCEV